MSETHGFFNEFFNGNKKIHIMEHRLALREQIMTKIKELRNYANTIEESIFELDKKLGALHDLVDEVIEEIGGES